MGFINGDLPDLHQPSNMNVKIWRYMDLSKFLNLIVYRSLFFCRADKFEDPYEGRLPKLDIEQCAAKVVEDFENSIKNFYINCWHMNETESAAMWKLYSTSSDAIAIETDYKTLRKILHKKVALTTVKYEDYTNFSLIKKSFELNGKFNGFDIVTYKRSSFEHEREIRAIYWGIQNTFEDIGEGVLVDIDISKLIKKVHISPYASPWLEEIILDLLDKYELAATPVIKSSLYSIK